MEKNVRNKKVKIFRKNKVKSMINIPEGTMKGILDISQNKSRKKLPRQFYEEQLQKSHENLAKISREKYENLLKNLFESLTGRNFLSGNNPTIKRIFG